MTRTWMVAVAVGGMLWSLSTRAQSAEPSTAPAAAPTAPAPAPAAPAPATSPAPEPPPAAPAPPPPSYPEPAAPAAPASSLGASPEPELEPPPRPIFGERPRRDGFTLELGLGLGITHVSPDVGDGDTRVGLAPLSLSLGGFLSPDLALMARMAGTTWFEDVGTSTVQMGSYFYGAALQYWPSDELFVAGGVGFGLLAANPLFSRTRGIDSEAGLAFTLRAGYAFYTSRDHALGLTLELFPELFDGVDTLGLAINFQWQLL